MAGILHVLIQLLKFCADKHQRKYLFVEEIEYICLYEL